MNLDFTKMHGAGNDFVFIDDLSEEIELTEAQVRFLCDRHFGIGADGVILVRPSKYADCAAYMHYINDDGSLAEMCGNGVRCFAKYLVDRGFVAASEGRFIAETLAGKRPISFEVDEDGLLTTATVDMGEPVFEPLRIPTTLTATSTVLHTLSSSDEPLDEPVVLETPLATPLGELNFTCVNMGNPHAVTFIAGLESLDISTAGPALETSEVFPQRANIEFVEVLSSGSDSGNSSVGETGRNGETGSDGDAQEAELRMRVWERGVGETLACGTGTCAAVVAASITGRSARKALVHLRGGDLRIQWLDNNHILMTGPAATVFEGTIQL